MTYFFFRLKTNIKNTEPNCNCFPADQAPPEPGPFYTHLGSAKSLAELRKNMENMSGIQGKGIRMEKVEHMSNIFYQLQKLNI